MLENDSDLNEFEVDSLSHNISSCLKSEMFLTG